MNQALIILLCVGILCPCGILARRWNTNKDSVVVDAYSEDEDEGELLFDAIVEQPDNTECITLDHEPGACVTLRRCHPILFADNGDLRNPSLAQDYSQSVDICGREQNAVDDESATYDVDLERAGGADNPVKSNIGNKIICCAKDKIQSLHRSETSEEELSMYPTTTIIPAVPFAEQGNTEQSILAEELLILDSETPASSSNVSEPVVDIVESTDRPEVAQILNKEVPVAANASAINVTASMPNYPESAQQTSSTTTTSPAEDAVSEAVAIPESPSSQQEQAAVPEEIPELNKVDDACPAVTAYNTWPAFENYPFLASIQVRAKTGPLCSGSLIDNRHVLTAAHCLHRFNSKDVARMQVRLGFSKNPLNDTFNHFYLERKASKIIFHKRFHEQSKMDNNIALVQLDQPVEFDDHIAPIQVFNGAAGFDQGSCAGVEAGWIKYGNRKFTGISDGVIQFVDPPMSDFVLREAIKKIYKNTDCQSQLYSEITDEMLCAKTDSFEAHGVSTDRFRGNDGGPLVIRVNNRVQQVGIKSWAYEVLNLNVYTKTDKYLDWIQDNLKI